MKQKSIRILPLGGLGDIGMNMTLVGCGEHWLAVDAGVQFCDPWTVGAEFVLPDLDLLSEYRDRIEALVITHGHEDHIGAIEHVVGACPVPVYAPAFVCELIRLKAEAFGAIGRPDLRPVGPGDHVEVGPMRVEFLRVTHSIPDSHAIAIRTPVGTVVFTGDYKIDPDPLDGRSFDTERLRALGDEGVRLLLGDSTNVMIPGHTPCEREVVASIEALVREAKGRVIVSLFASNVHRVRALVDLAVRCGRRVALVGKSLHVYHEAAVRSGRGERLPEMVDAHQLDRVPDQNLMVVCTGSQSERRSVLYRASAKDHPDLSIHAGDLVVLSSRIIPGNERSIHKMIDNLIRQGARVVHERAARVHASGHAQQDELREMLRLVRPKTFVPVHGEYAYLAAHAEMAREEGVEDVRVLENGYMLEVTAKDANVVEHVPLTFHYVDGPVVGDAAELRLDERRRIGWTGVVAARLVAERGKKKWRVKLDVQAVGVPTLGGTVLDEAAAYAAEQVASLPREAGRKEVEDTLLGSLRAFFRRKLDRKPTILSFIEVAGG